MSGEGSDPILPAAVLSCAAALAGCSDDAAPPRLLVANTATNSVSTVDIGTATVTGKFIASGYGAQPANLDNLAFSGGKL